MLNWQSLGIKAIYINLFISIGWVVFWLVVLAITKIKGGG